MPYTHVSSKLISAVIGLSLLAWSAAVSALLAEQLDEAHQIVRPSLAFIQMRGETPEGLPRATQGTGFLVSEDGYILTTYHLLRALGQDIKPEPLSIEISLGRKKPGFDEQAFIVDARPNLDLLLLKIPRGPENYSPVTLNSIRALEASVPEIVYVSGFPSDLPHMFYTDQVVSHDGPGGYTWVLQRPVDAGLSGSPVYLGDGTVVGIMKGTLENTAVFIPIDHADALLLPMRFSALERRTIGDFEDRVADIKRVVEQQIESTLALRAIPTGAVVPFRLADCPGGWTRFEEAAGRMIIGVGQGDGLTRRTLDEFDGEEKHVLTVPELPPHGFKYLTPRREVGNLVDSSGERSSWRLHVRQGYYTDPIGEGLAHNNMPPFYALLYCVKD